MGGRSRGKNKKKQLGPADLLRYTAEVRLLCKRINAIGTSFLLHKPFGKSHSPAYSGSSDGLRRMQGRLRGPLQPTQGLYNTEDCTIRAFKLSSTPVNCFLGSQSRQHSSYIWQDTLKPTNQSGINTEKRWVSP